MAISDNIKEIQAVMRAERIAQQSNAQAPTPVSNDVQSKATKAILGGIVDYVEYMKLFAKNEAELARLIPTDGSTEPERQRARAYLVRNGMCGHGTGDLFLENVTNALN